MADLGVEGGVMVAALLIGGTAVGWLVVYAVFLGGPRLGRPRRRRRLTPTPELPRPGTIALLADRTVSDGYAATLLDLSARGWFELSGSGPLVAKLPPEAPAGPLTVPERLAAGHLAQRAGAQRTFPADALMDGFAGGEDEFMKEFRGGLIADSRARGLSRPTLSGARKALLCLLALIPSAAVLLAAAGSHTTHRNMFVIAGIAYVYLCGMVAVVSSERLTESGEAALAAVAPPAGRAGREIAYAVALGNAASPLIPPGKNAAWSGYGDSWRLVTIGDSTERTWPGISNGAFGAIVVLIIPGVPMIGAITFAVAGVQAAKLAVLATLLAAAGLYARAYARWSHLPRFAEFDGLVVRQWLVGTKDSDDGPDYHVAIDDGMSAKAWAFKVGGDMFGRLTTGTVAHVRVNPRQNKLLSIEPLRRLPTAPLLAETVDPRAQESWRAE